jgi:hypothetical protein
MKSMARMARIAVIIALPAVVVFLTTANHVLGATP